jgi:hypothetical protein
MVYLKFFIHTAYKEEVDYAKEDNVDLYSPLYDKACYDDIMMNGQIKLMETLLILLIYKMIFFLNPYEVNQDLEIHNAFQIHCFNHREKSIISTLISLLICAHFISMTMMSSKVFLCF